MSTTEAEPATITIDADESGKLRMAASEIRGGEQMTLDVGGEIGIAIEGSVRVAGGMVAIKELPKGADVRVVVTDEDGELISTGAGYVSSVAFKEQRPKDRPHWTERIHSITLA